MTKQEIKDLVATKIKGQGNQVDLGSALSAIIGEILDRVPERALITIDLSGFELSDEDTDVTSAIPSGYVPQVGDKIKTDIYGVLTFGGMNYLGDNGWWATFGYSYVEESATQLYLHREGDNVIYASMREI